MRKFYSFLLATVALLCSTAANAQSFTIDNLNYAILSSTDKTVELTGGSPSGELVIPSTVTYELVDYTVTEVAAGAFQYNKTMTSVTIPATIEYIRSAAFSDCSNVTAFNVAADNATYVSENGVIYTKDMSTIILCPNTTTGVYKIRANVSTIGDCAFDGCTKIEKIIIPQSVSTIGQYAFANCELLTELTIPASVTSIDDTAFGAVGVDDCDNLKEITLLATTPPTWYGAMQILPEDVKINVPAGAAATYAATYGWTEFTNIVEANGKCGDNAYWALDEGALTIFGTGAMYNYAGNDANRAPWYSNKENINSVTIEEGVTSIGNFAFDDCYNLTSIEIPSSVTSIDDYAFYYCTSLTSIEIPSSVTSIGKSAFYNCISLTSIEIPSSVTSIGESAFEACYGLTSIEIPSSVTSIGDNAFAHCTGLTSITSHIAAENLFAPGNNAFLNVDKNACTLYVPAGAKSTYAATEQWKDFTNIVEPNGKCGDNAYWTLNEETGALTIFGTGAMYNYNHGETPWHSNKENITSVTIEEGVTSIGNCAFWNCSGLTSIEIPSNVTSIGKYTFDGCNDLTSIVVDEGNTIYDSRGNCNAIIETASNTLIAGCKNTIIPASVTNIGNYAFSGCYGLTSIEIPSSVTSIGDGAFHDCNGLTSIEIPNSVTRIGNSAFYYCSGLTSIEIPSGVTSIGNNAFSGCYGLTSIVSHIAAENLFAPGENAFSDLDKDACTLYVPAGAKSTYAATEQWKDFTNIVETYDLTITAAGYATLYLGTAVEIPAGVEAYTAARIEGDLLKMQAVEDVIPANTAVIIKAEEGKYTFIPSNETPDAIEGNLLRGTLIDTYIKPASAQTAYVLSKVDGIVGMYRAKLKADGTFKNNANRVYMLLGDINVGEGDLDTSNPGGQLSNGYRFDFSGTTAIEGIQSEQGEAVYYDLSGRRVENPTKGIYIVNGRKVLIK